MNYSTLEDIRIPAGNLRLLAGQYVRLLTGGYALFLAGEYLITYIRLHTGEDDIRLPMQKVLDDH